MEKVETIPKIMRKHHSQLDGILTKLQRHHENIDESKKNFNKFKWELKKHFLLEEKAIFIFIYQEDDEIYKMKNDILNDHRIILKELDKVEAELNNDQVINLLGLRDQLIKHRTFEDDSFYPKLEEELDDDKKKEILDRITNPV